MFFRYIHNLVKRIKEDYNLLMKKQEKEKPWNV